MDTNARSNSAIFAAIDQGLDEIEILQDFLHQGGNPDLTDNRGYSLLMHAIDTLHRTACPEMVELLLNYGADVNCTANYGTVSALTLAIYDEDMARLMLNHALLDKQSSASGVALLKAADIHDRQKRMQIFKLFIDAEFPETQLRTAAGYRHCNDLLPVVENHFSTRTACKRGHLSGPL